MSNKHTEPVGRFGFLLISLRLKDPAFSKCVRYNAKMKKKKT